MFRSYSIVCLDHTVLCIDHRALCLDYTSLCLDHTALCFDHTVLCVLICKVYLYNCPCMYVMSMIDSQSADMI